MSVSIINRLLPNQLLYYTSNQLDLKCLITRQSKNTIVTFPKVSIIYIDNHISYEVICHDLGLLFDHNGYYTNSLTVNTLESSLIPIQINHLINLNQMIIQINDTYTSIKLKTQHMIPYDVVKAYMIFTSEFDIWLLIDNGLVERSIKTIFDSYVYLTTMESKLVNLKLEQTSKHQALIRLQNQLQDMCTCTKIHCHLCSNRSIQSYVNIVQMSCHHNFCTDCICAWDLKKCLICDLPIQIAEINRLNQQIFAYDTIIRHCKQVHPVLIKQKLLANYPHLSIVKTCHELFEL